MTTRRTFIAQASLVAAGMIPALNLLAKAAAPAKRGVAGLQLYSLRDQLPTDVRGWIGKVAQAGYQDVETFGLSNENTYWSLSPKLFKGLLEDNHLVSTSGHYGLDGYLAGGADTDVVRYIKVMHEIGQTYLTIPYLGDSIRKTGDDWKKIAEKFNTLGARLKGEGLKLAYHNHNFEFGAVDGTTGYDILLQNTDHSVVHFEMDLYWVVRAGADPISLFKKYPGRFVMWHIKDMDKAHPELNTEVGSGSIDFKAIFEHAGKAGLTQTFMEQENYASGMDPLTSISQSAAYIKSNLL